MIRHWFILSLWLTPLASLAVHGDDFDGLRLNQIQVIGSHNSYKLALDPSLLKLIGRVNEDHAKALEYSHLPLTQQLDLGLRGLELDVLNDPEGGRFADPLGRRLQQSAGEEILPYDAEVMQQAGFKVLHSQDIDFRSNCPNLHDAYRELRKWSETHPDHLPVIVTFNAKSGPSVLPGGVTALEFDEASLMAWDKLSLAEFGRDRLLTPADVQGSATTLEEAVLTTGWPKLDNCRGKFLLVLDETGPIRERYLAQRDSKNRVMFTTSPPGSPAAAVLIMNDPLAERAQIQERVKQGYLVRTRADADTWEARRSDVSRFTAAEESGAQLISTDFYRIVPEISPIYVVRWPDGKFQRPNPITAKSSAKSP
jgi:hypothetical protein